MTITTADRFTFNETVKPLGERVPVHLRTERRTEDHWIEVCAICFVLLLGFLSNMWDFLILGALAFGIAKSGFFIGHFLSQLIPHPMKTESNSAHCRKQLVGGSCTR